MLKPWGYGLNTFNLVFIKKTIICLLILVPQYGPLWCCMLSAHYVFTHHSSRTGTWNTIFGFRSNSSQMLTFNFLHCSCNEFPTFFGNAGIWFIAFLKNIGNSLHKKCYKIKVDIWLEVGLSTWNQPYLIRFLNFSLSTIGMLSTL